MAADLGDLSIEELANLEISSVSKRPQPLSSAASAIYAITNDDIRRSGFTTLTDALRLAPNLLVGRMSAYQHAVSARGFNGYEAANKLLVLIDGRSVYSPLHSGVFWEAQDVVLEDVERIEVISGPGGTLWGANAVNGVINVITKNSADTQGGFVSGSYGTGNRHAAARYGGAISDKATYRAYVKGTYFDDSKLPNGTDWGDDWSKIQGGAAFDWRGESDTVAVKGDIYDGELDNDPTSTFSGLNGSVHWTHHFADGSPLDVQAYYDRTRKIAPPGIDELIEAYNIDVQHNFLIGSSHNIVWGGGYRVTDDYFDNGSPFVLVEPFGTLKLANVFVQDEIALTEDLSFTAGLKLEHHTYTGWEYMPNARLAWEAGRTTMFWASISRAVRTPSRIDRELSSPGILLPADNFESETLIAYEAGYRGQPTANTTLTVSAYYNDYDKIRTTAFGPGNTLPVMFMNAIEGHTYGVEAWGNYEVLEWWRLSAGMNLIHKNLRVKPGIVDLANMQAAGNDPSHQFLLRSQMNPFEDVELDVGLRIVDDLPDPAIDAYTEMDVRLGWHLTETLELSLAGLNLLHDHHPESGTPAQRAEVPRSVYAGARWSF